MEVTSPDIYKYSKHWLNESAFIVTSGNNFHLFIARVISEVYDP